MSELPYLVVTVRLSLYDTMTLPLPAQDAILMYLNEHGIDTTREFSWMDEPGSLQRVYRQTHYSESHDVS